MKKIFSICLFICLPLFIMSACNEEKSAVSQEDEDDPIQIVTTIAQIGEPLQVIGGDRVEVESLMGPSVDPHLYQATQSDISTFENADIIFYNGLGLEANMVDIFEEIGKSRPVLAIGETIEEENLLEDEEGNVDPHIWFDLDLWMNALDAAVASLSEYAPEHADYFQENKAAYFAKLEEVKQDSTKLAALPKNKRILVTAHDAFGYFGNMHDIQVIGLQGLSTDSEIGVSDINDTIAVIEKHKVPAIFIESSINDSSIQAVIEGAASKGLDVELGGELYSDAMGEEGTEEGTYIGMYRHNVNTIYEALSGGEN
ncbi:metal ABC transporter solute-binding protein, Zn/Mn family [Alteribacillus iranensis]|uniref:Manganese/zinc/iron transport system substrate-binding protein n=1 Tax=Alteribacillus iranensis TaxID=930128 RepID=A0A1I2DHZ5_9BACI|nr:manganese/zinc/iron transport system substrate-binding protein [Alteribacillus iranensis]